MSDPGVTLAEPSGIKFGRPVEKRPNVGSIWSQAVGVWRLLGKAPTGVGLTIRRTALVVALLGMSRSVTSDCTCSGMMPGPPSPPQQVTTFSGSPSLVAVPSPTVLLKL